MKTREYYMDLLHKHITNTKMIAHCVASEFIMRALARKLNEDEDKWGYAGLLHDIDVEITNADAKTHGIVGAKMLENELPADAVDAIKMHNECATGQPRFTLFQHALAAVETLSGLIFATALVYPDKKIESVKVKSVTKRMKEKAFAASVKRENIMECEQIGIPLDEFVDIALTSLKPVAQEIGF